jgi:hypothetical protein
VLGVLVSPMATTDPTDRIQLVKLARTLERQLARRRKVIKTLTDIDREIRDTRKFLRDLTEPDASEVYKPADDAPVGG